MKVPAEVHRALVALAAVDEFVRLIQQAQHTKEFQQAKLLFDNFQSHLDQRHKQLAMKAHPDRGGDEERMKEINGARDVLRKALQIVPVQPRPRPVVIHVHMSGGFGGFNTTTNSTSYTSTGWYGGPTGGF